jgi:hypothetical protein
MTVTLPDWIPSLEPVLPLLLVVVAAGVIVALTLWTYKGSSARSRRMRYLLVTLRLLALLVAVLILVRPTWTFHEHLRRPGKIIVLIDSSRSMRVKDEEPEGATRWETALKEWNELRAQVELWEKEYQLRVLPLAFDAIVREFKPDLLPDGGSTGLLQAIEQAVEKNKSADTAEGEQLLGVVVLSDGRDNVGRPTVDVLLARLETARCKLHTIGLGKPGSSDTLFDIAALNIAAPKIARVKDRIQVTGQVQANRAVNQDLEAYLLIDGKPAMQADGDRIGQPVMVKLTPRKASETMRVEFPACRLPDAPGDYRFSLFVKPIPGEASEANNEVSTYVTLSKEGLSVLYFDKDRAWEPKFLKRALKSDERISLEYAYAGTSSPAWRQDVRNAIQTRAYDVFIIGDVPASRFQNQGDSGDEILSLIDQAVRNRGAGLLMIGGHESFADGGWNNTPLASILPVTMNQNGQLEGEIGTQREIKFKPTEEGLKPNTAYSFPLRLDSDPQKNTEWWLSLPKLDGGSRMGSLKTGAVKLAESEQGDILLAVNPDIGKGRSAALAVDTTWRWVRPGPPHNPPPAAPGAAAAANIEAQPSASAEAHLRFWRQLILWLARQEQTSEGVNLELESRRVMAGKEMSFTVQARAVTPGGAKDAPKPIEGAEYFVRVVKPNKEEESVSVTPLGDTEAKSRGIFWKTDEPGEYEVVVSARLNGKEIGTARARFMSVRDDSETLNQAANHTLLEQLAVSSGGTFRLHGGLRDVIESMSNDPSAMEDKRIIFPEWQEPNTGRQGTLFVLFVMLIIVEWVLRRWWGMV